MEKIDSCRSGKRFPALCLLFLLLPIMPVYGGEPLPALVETTAEAGGVSVGFPVQSSEPSPAAVDSIREDQAVALKLSGFVKTDYWYDSRSVIASREDLFLLYPANRMPDAQGQDLHGDPVFNFSAITSRIAAHIAGPPAFGASTSGLIEADFSGVTNADINGFRLRHAYMKLSWDQAELLLGQWWHPMFSADVVPSVVSLNTGAPFQPFIRNPQISFTLKHGSSRLLLVAIAQRDNSSDGPRGLSPDYLRQSALPNFHLQWVRAGEVLTGGLAVDYKSIRPRFVTESFLKTSEGISSYALMGYLRYRRNGWDIMGKSIFGQNLSEHLLMGGYAERSVSPATGRVEYTPLNHLMVWGNVLYGNRVRAGLFAGWSGNLGASHEVTGNYYGRGHDIAYVYRLSPSVVFTSGRMSLATELEWTVAAYGLPDNRGKVQQANEVGNLRLLFTGMYYF